jgi:SOS-response transcriptional repressor LexA
MPEKREILRRLIEWAHSKVGSEWGWKSRLAIVLETTPQEVNRVLSGRFSIGPGTRERLAKAGADVEWIMTGKSVKDAASANDRLIRGPFAEIPVIGKVLATPEGKQYFEDLPEGVSVPYFKGPYFALVVENDSLIHAPEGERSMPLYPNDIVLFDPTRQPRNGDIVAIQLKQTHDRMVKVLKHRGRDEVELLSFNTFRNYPSIVKPKEMIASFGVFVTVIKPSRAELRRLGLTS